MDYSYQQALVWLASVVHFGLHLDIPSSPCSLTNIAEQKLNLPP